MNENAADWFLDRHLKEGRGAKTVFREYGGDKRSISYAELVHRSAQFAGALQRADIRREERIACLVLDQIAGCNKYTSLRGCLRCDIS